MDDLMGTYQNGNQESDYGLFPKRARKVRAFEKGLEKRLQVLDEKINANMTDVNLEYIGIYTPGIYGI